MDQNLVKKQSHKMTLFAIILSVISIGLLVFGFFMVSSDKVVMLQSISNLTSKLDKIYEDSELMDKIASSKNIGVRSKIELSSEPLGLDATLDLDYLENKNDKKSNLAFKLSSSDTVLLDLNTVLASNNLYLFVDQLTPNYYYTALEYFTVFSELNSKDYEKIVDVVKNSIIDTIDNDDIKKEKVTISYNGKDKKVNQLTYEINKDVIYSILNKMITEIKNDKELLTSFSLAMGIDSDDLITNLNQLLGDIKDSKDNSVLYYTVYYYGFNKIVQYELSDGEVMLQYKVEDKEIISLYSEDEVLLSLEIKKNKKQYDFSGFIKNNELEKLNYSGTLDGNELTLLFDVDGQSVKITVNNVSNNYKETVNITLASVVEQVEQVVLTLKVNNEYYFDQKVDVNLDDSVNIENITEEELNTLTENLENHPIFQLFNNFSQLENSL